MSPVFIGAMIVAGLLYVALVLLEFLERAELARLEEQRRRMASMAVFSRRLDELRARAFDADQDELEDGCQGGHPAPQPIGLQILGETDAAIAEELIRQTARHRGSRA